MKGKVKEKRKEEVRKSDGKRASERNVTRANKPERVEVKKQKEGRTEGRRWWGEECLQNVRREPKSTGQQTVREGKTSQIRPLNTVRLRARGGNCANSLLRWRCISSASCFFKTSKIPMVQYYCVITARGAED